MAQNNEKTTVLGNKVTKYFIFYPLWERVVHPKDSDKKIGSVNIVYEFLYQNCEEESNSEMSVIEY